MTVFWIVIGALIAIGALIVIFFLLTLWQLSKEVSDALADIRHGKGIFLTFKYTPEEWEYYTQNLPLTGESGKVCFTRKHIYLSDGTEEILYEISNPYPFFPCLREISLDEDFIIFTVRNKKLTDESEKEIPDSPDNLKQYHILIPKAQQQQAGEIISFYQQIIDKNNEKRDKLLN